MRPQILNLHERNEVRALITGQPAEPSNVSLTTVRLMRTGGRTNNITERNGGFALAHATARGGIAKRYVHSGTTV